MSENELKRRAEEIRDEVKVSANTANRIGQFLLDLFGYITGKDGVPFARRAKADESGNVIEKTYMTKTDGIAITPIFLSEEEYEELSESGKLDPKLMYMIYEEEESL